MLLFLDIYWKTEYMWERDTTVKSAMTGHLFTQSIHHYRGYPPRKKYSENFF